jgi:hypothetical protein
MTGKLLKNDKEVVMVVVAVQNGKALEYALGRLK